MAAVFKSYIITSLSLPSSPLSSLFLLGVTLLLL